MKVTLSATRPDLTDLVHELNIAVMQASANGQRKGQAVMNRLTVLYPEAANAIISQQATGTIDCDPYYVRDSTRPEVWQDFWYIIYALYGQRV